jgi:hypothetical protein
MGGGVRQDHWPRLLASEIYRGIVREDLDEERNPCPLPVAGPAVGQLIHVHQDVPGRSDTQPDCSQPAGSRRCRAARDRRAPKGRPAPLRSHLGPRGRCRGVRQRGSVPASVVRRTDNRRRYRRRPHRHHPAPHPDLRHGGPAHREGNPTQGDRTAGRLSRRRGGHRPMERLPRICRGTAGLPRRSAQLRSRLRVRAQVPLAPGGSPRWHWPHHSLSPRR